MRFGRLVTVADVGRAADGHRLWSCACDCGASCIRQSNNLQVPATASCGCAATEIHSAHGMRYSSTYSSWQAAKRRCESPDNKDYPRYGARGIRMCERWRDSFEAFLADMGERPQGTSLDRWPSNTGNYEPGNCRWATAQEQARNRHNSTWVEWKGVRTHLSDVAASLGITFGAAFNRLQRGKLYD